MARQQARRSVREQAPPPARAFAPLDEFEASVVRLMADGHDLPAIARALGVDEAFVRSALERLEKRLAAIDRQPHR